MSSHLCLGLPKGLFPAGIPVKILKELLHSSILATWLAHLNLLDLITLTILGDGKLNEIYPKKVNYIIKNMFKYNWV